MFYDQVKNDVRVVGYPSDINHYSLHRATQNHYLGNSLDHVKVMTDSDRSAHSKLMDGFARFLNTIGLHSADRFLIN